MPLKSKKSGISLKTIYAWMIIGAIIISTFMFYSTFRLSSDYKKTTKAAEQHVALRKDTKELMDASDYLTEAVQRFVINRDIKYLKGYFEEAKTSKHREDAIKKLSAGTDNEAAVKELKSAMNNSIILMNLEYYAMKLIVDADADCKAYFDEHPEEYPDEVKNVTLSDADESLDSDGKIRRASEVVFNEEYAARKALIRKNMEASLNELEKAATSDDESAVKSLSDEMIVIRIAIVLQTLGVAFLVWLTSRLGIHPIMNAVKSIKSDKKLDEAGAREFRYLVRAYNKMYEAYKKSIENLNFKALHDELTGVYNRAGYQSLVESIDLKSTYMILFDVDDFKDINDNFGHETGDKVLIKLANVLKNNFRLDDYICRIGGDEFVVFMINSPEKKNDLLKEKIDAINKEFSRTDDGLPPASISAGIVHGSDVKDNDDMFVLTDKAMYESKQKGKNTLTFYK